MKLTEIELSKPVRITDMACSNRLVSRRLNDLGIMEGTLISIIKRLPFGGPITLEASNQWISIRRSEALQILVEAV
ncbi:FeoA domain protein [compost metagenome]